jgi:hypothetical protein
MIEHISYLKLADLKLGRKDIFTGANAFLIWKYVRFNPNYRATYDEFMQRFKPTLETREREDAICSKWGIPRLINPEEVDLPDGFYFKRISVIPIRYSDPVEFENYFPSVTNEINKEIGEGWRLGIKPLVLVLNPFADRKAVLKKIGQEVDSFYDSIDELTSRKRHQRIKGSNRSNLVTTFVCFYMRTVLKKTPTEIRKVLKEEFGLHVGLQSHQIDRKVKVFRKYAEAAPFIFFNLPR